MDALKNVIMADSNTESGQEPVSGSQGQGTAVEPYDQGNQEDLAGKSAQSAGESQTTGADKPQSGQEPVSGSQGQGTAGDPFDQGNQQDKPELAGKAPPQTGSSEQVPAPSAATAGAHESSSNTIEQPNGVSLFKHAAENEVPAPFTKKPTIGSSGWFANADPFGQKTSVSGAAAEHDVDPKAKAPIEEQATGGAERPVVETKNLPPNHLGDDVPQGMSSTIVEPTSTSQSGQNTPGLASHLGEDVSPGGPAMAMGKGKGKARAIDTEDIDSTASNRSELTREESINTETAHTRRTYSTAGTGASSISSRRQSMIQSGRIPTAGGVPLGARAAADRQHRLDSLIPENEATSSTSRLGTIEYYGSPKPSTPSPLGPEARRDADAAKPAVTNTPATKTGEDERIARRATKKVKGFRKSISKAFKGREGSQ